MKNSQARTGHQRGVGGRWTPYSVKRYCNTREKQRPWLCFCVNNNYFVQEFAAFKQSTLNTLADLVNRFQAASDAAATAGDATDDGDDDATNSNPAACSDADGGVCAPSVEADGQNLRINAPGGAFLFFGVHPRCRSLRASPQS